MTTIEVGDCGSAGGLWKWHGAVVGHDNVIYAVPQKAERVLRIDPSTDSVSFIGDRFEGENKWAGGVVARQP